MSENQTVTRREIFIAHRTIEEVVEEAQHRDSIYVLSIRRSEPLSPGRIIELVTLSVMVQYIRHRQYASEVHYCNVTASRFTKTNSDPPQPPDADETKAMRRADQLEAITRQYITRAAETAGKHLAISEATVMIPEDVPLLTGAFESIRFDREADAFVFVNRKESE